METLLKVNEEARQVSINTPPILNTKNENNLKNKDLTANVIRGSKENNISDNFFSEGTNKKVAKNKDSLAIIEEKAKIKQIKNNLPPIFSEAHKSIKNEKQAFKTETSNNQNKQVENSKNYIFIKRNLTTNIMKNVTGKTKPKGLPFNFNLENKIEEGEKAEKVNDEILKKETIKKKNSTKKETILAREKQINSLKACGNLEEWKKRNKIDKYIKVFICFIGYPDMRKALLNRGWHENLDQDSLLFDFKCSLSSKNIDHDKVEKFQVLNHFENSGEITRKVRLCYNLRNLKWVRDINIDTFFPRCYDVSEMNDFEDFVEDFKITKAESILKDYYYDIRNIDEKILRSCIEIFHRKFVDIDDDLDNIQIDSQLISNKEWEIICEGDLILVNENETDLKMKAENESNTTFKRSKSSSNKIVNRKFSQNYNVPKIISYFKPDPNSMKSKLKKMNKSNDPVTNDPKYKDEVKSILDKLKEKNPQYDLNGSRNVWIMKPSGLSRGRGIKCLDTLSEIFKQFKHGLNQFVVQKYIENSLIIHNRKFDIRQWVLVSSFNPLTIWIYEEPYMRFGAEDFDLNNIKNLFSHLTNNAIACKSNKFDNSTIPENMWYIGDFRNYLNETYERDIYTEVIRPKMKDIIIYSLESVQDVIKNRKNSHEIYGYDLMVDSNFDVWLIEINASPCMEYSTEITKKLVQLVMDDSLKVLIDYQNNPNADTGLWSLIHKGKFIETPQVPVGFNLVCEGVKIKLTQEI